MEIGDKVTVMTQLYLGRWISPGEQGVVSNIYVNLSGQQVYGLTMADGKEYILALNEILAVPRC